MNNISQSSHEARRAQAGFTLVEVLIAIIVLVFGLIAITNLFLVAGSSNTVANQATAASDVAAQILEDFKAQPWNSAQLTATTGTFPATTPQNTVSIPGVGVVESWWSITDVDNRTKFIRVRSQGTGALSKARSRAEFTTYRTCTTPILGCP